MGLRWYFSTRAQTTAQPHDINKIGRFLTVVKVMNVTRDCA